MTNHNTDSLNTLLFFRIYNNRIIRKNIYTHLNQNSYSNDQFKYDVVSLYDSRFLIDNNCNDFIARDQIDRFKKILNPLENSVPNQNRGHTFYQDWLDLPTQRGKERGDLQFFNSYHKDFNNYFHFHKINLSNGTSFQDIFKDLVYLFPNSYNCLFTLLIDQEFGDEKTLELFDKYLVPIIPENFQFNLVLEVDIHFLIPPGYYKLFKSMVDRNLFKISLSSIEHVKKDPAFQQYRDLYQRVAGWNHNIFFLAFGKKNWVGYKEFVKKNVKWLIQTSPIFHQEPHEKQMAYGIMFNSKSNLLLNLVYDEYPDPTSIYESNFETSFISIELFQYTLDYHKKDFINCLLKSDQEFFLSFKEPDVVEAFFNFIQQQFGEQSLPSIVHFETNDIQQLKRFYQFKFKKQPIIPEFNMDIYRFLLEKSPQSLNSSNIFYGNFAKTALDLVLQESNESLNSSNILNENNLALGYIAAIELGHIEYIKFFLKNNIYVSANQDIYIKIVENREILNIIKTSYIFRFIKIDLLMASVTIPNLAEFDELLYLCLCSGDGHFVIGKFIEFIKLAYSCLYKTNLPEKQKSYVVMINHLKTIGKKLHFKRPKFLDIFLSFSTYFQDPHFLIDHLKFDSLNEQLELFEKYIQNNQLSRKF
ncbi:hypothetical protein CYY_002017 [Polysphondylium violaceum]|uniref:Uncharacterized protein n=1 Tax=Polysphondylium violaceum TaxID=133409 RepID=A0A8J4Q1Y9_9MYCE|nr:hypothetical protein CYY_002017 [Polysphondylium violaceum]